MAKKRSGLGRGLSALFPEEPVEEERSQDTNSRGEDKGNLDNKTSIYSDGVRDLPAGNVQNDSGTVHDFVTAQNMNRPEDNIQTLRVSRIEPDPSQPRKSFTEEELDQLAESIKEHGLLQPIIVTPEEGTSRYLIVAGERRWRACQKAAIPTIQCIVRTFDNKQAQLEASLIENIQREDLNPIEEANAYQRLIKEFNLTQEEVAEKVSKSRTAVTNSLRLLKLDPEVQKMVIDGKLSMGHARALIPVEDMEQQRKLANEIIENNLNVREVEKLIRNMGKPRKNVSRETNPSLAAIYKDVQNRMQQTLGMNVKVSYKNDKSGKVEISFANDDDLEKLMSIIFGA